MKIGVSEHKILGSVEDCTLPHLSYWNPPESAGFHWTPPDSTPGICWCDKGQIGMSSPGGVHRSPLEFTKFRRSPWNPTRQIPVDSSGLVQQTPADSTGLHQTPPDSTGLHRTPPDSTGLHWIPPDSTGLQQIPPDSSKFHWTPPDSSRTMLFNLYIYIYKKKMAFARFEPMTLLLFNYGILTS